MVKTLTQFRALTGLDRIDAENGVIYGVSVMTIGPALGHGTDIDQKGLNQCLLACLSHGEEGVKLIIKHNGELHDSEGACKNFRIEGNQLLADAYLLETGTYRAKILELAQKMPSEFGLSVETTGAHEAVPNSKTKLYRCDEIDCIALVPKPAANPTGLFQQPNTPPMDEEKLKAMFEEALGPINDRLSKLEEGAKPPEEEKTEETDCEEVDEKNETEEAKLSRIISAATTAAVTKFAASIGVKSAPKSSGESATVVKLTKFEAKVEQLAREGVAKPFQAAVHRFPAEYGAHCEAKGGKH